MTWWKPKKERRSQARLDRDNEHDMKLRQGHEALLNAATTTADIANDITTILKGKLDDSIKQIEITARLLHDALIVTDHNNVITSFNNSAERIFGWKAAEVMGFRIDALFRASNGSKVDVEQIFESLYNDTEYSVDDQCNEPIEQIRGKKKNGELFWIDGNISKFTRLDGSVCSIIFVKDMSKIMSIQQMLHENEVRYRSIFEQSFDGIVIVDNYHIVAANPAIATMTGYGVEQLIAKPFSNFIHEDYQKLVNQLHAARIKGDTNPHNYLLKIFKEDGGVVDVLCSSTMMKWEGRNASLITIKDLTNINS